MEKRWKRRQWLQSLGAVGGALWMPRLSATGTQTANSEATSQEPIQPLDIGARRELFVDDWLIEKASGCRRQLNRPQRREIVFRTDAPWEGNGSGYQSILHDGERWLMYYRGGHHPASPAYEKDPRSWETLCVAVSTNAMFMSSRDGVRFKLFDEAFIRPGAAREDTWVYGDNFIFWGMTETASDLSAAPPEISLYATEGYWEGEFTSVRRYTSRLDGFVSMTAPHAGGELLTKLLRFTGRELRINVSTSAAGSVRIGIEDINGKSLPGYTNEDCDPLFGDGIEELEPVTPDQSR